MNKKPKPNELLPLVCIHGKHPDLCKLPHNIERIMYGIPKGETERHAEVLLLTNIQSDAQIERVKAMATKDGFHSFRVATVDLSVVPDFGRTVNR